LSPALSYRRAYRSARHPGSRGAAETVRDLQQAATHAADPGSARPLRPGWRV